MPLLILLASMIVSDCAGVVAKPVGVGHGETRSLTKDRHAGRRITYANPRRSAGGKNVPKLSRMIHDGGADKQAAWTNPLVVPSRVGTIVTPARPVPSGTRGPAAGRQRGVKAREECQDDGATAN